MAMKALAKRESWDSVIDAKKDDMGTQAIQELLTIASAFHYQSFNLRKIHDSFTRFGNLPTHAMRPVIVTPME